MDTNVRLPRRMRRYFSSMCILGVFVLVFLGPGTIISTMVQALTLLNFGNFIGGIGNMVRSLTGIGKGGPCHFTCPDGSKPRPDPVHASTTNGCGVFGFQVDSQLFPAVTTCCEKHDICYDKCNSDKSRCDTDFQTCLRMICKNLHKATGGTELYEGCVSIADLAYKATDAAGCKTFLESQSNACICEGSEKPNRKGTSTPHGQKSAKQNSTKTPPPNTDPSADTNPPSDKSVPDDSQRTNTDRKPFKQKRNSPPQDEGGTQKTTKTKEQSQNGYQDTFGQEDPQGNVIYDHANVVKANVEKTSDRQNGRFSNRKKEEKEYKKRNRQRNNEEEFDSDGDFEEQSSKYQKRKKGKRKDEF